MAAIPVAAVTNVGLFLLAFRVLTVSEVPTRHLWIGATVGRDRLADRAADRAPTTWPAR